MQVGLEVLLDEVLEVVQEDAVLEVRSKELPEMIQEEDALMKRPLEVRLD